MNIKEAKLQIINAVRAYHDTDKFGNYKIPLKRQRPIFLMGPSGIGKTDIMEQVASELDIGLVCYTMTHQTRQSSQGLPRIEERVYDGKEYYVTKYTMSEIIASVYETMEKTKKREGILFLDEMNCVSETLSPTMLQFLQYKTFGNHELPEGWVVVTAGNPPEYNKSVREFDIATWDRLKRIDVEPDFDVWKEYAYNKGIHPAIITYLELKKNNFYKFETNVDGKQFVTARGWADLSDIIKRYEEDGTTVDLKLISQYVQHNKIAHEFCLYYELWRKYRSDYQVDAILAGKAPEEIMSRARSAKFDERLSLLGLILDALIDKARDVYCGKNVVDEVLSVLKQVKIALTRPGTEVIDLLKDQVKVLNEKIEKGKLASNLSSEYEYILRETILCIDKIISKEIEATPKNNQEAFQVLKSEFDNYKKENENMGYDTIVMFNNAFIFCENVFSDGQEILILSTELTISKYCAYCISRYGCDEYFKHNKKLLLHERHGDIKTILDNADLGEY